jgi:hypothetical protein
MCAGTCADPGTKTSWGLDMLDLLCSGKKVEVIRKIVVLLSRGSLLLFETYRKHPQAYNHQRRRHSCLYTSGVQIQSATCSARGLQELG